VSVYERYHLYNDVYTVHVAYITVEAALLLILTDYQIDHINEKEREIVVISFSKFPVHRMDGTFHLML